MDVNIEHPTDRPNFTRVDLGGLTVWFSYRTAVAYRVGWSDMVVRENDWGPTTGRHLNYVDDGHKDQRINGKTFENMLSAVLARLNVTEEDVTPC